MRRSSAAVVVVLALAGCTSTITGSPTPGPAGSALATALSRVPAAALGDGYFEFGDSARLQQLAGTDPAMWKFQVNTGASSLSNYATYTVDTIGVDLSSATSALTVGQPPSSMIVITGGQDRSRIVAAATRSGWTAGEVLSRDLDLSQGSAAIAGITLDAPRIRPIGADVVLGQAGADPAGVAAAGTAARTPADQVPGAKAATGCLGDVPTALGTGITSADASTWTVVGAGAGGPGTASSVICLGASDTAAADALADTVRSAVQTGRSERSGQPWRELLPSAKVDVLPGSPAAVRITASTKTAGQVFSMLAAQDVPGR